MESGYDFVGIYINSQFKGQVLSGKMDPNELVYRVDWNENDMTTKIEYENPEIVTWSDDNQCIIQRPTWRNPSRWDGQCG